MIVIVSESDVLDRLRGYTDGKLLQRGYARAKS